MQGVSCRTLANLIVGGTGIATGAGQLRPSSLRLPDGAPHGAAAWDQRLS